jgi:hypothetical protein
MSSAPVAESAPLPAEETAAPALRDRVRDGGVTWRAALLSLVLAGVFGYVIPIVDYRFNNTFIGAAHLPPGAIAALLLVLLVINPLLRVAAKKHVLSRNETLAVFATCLFSCLVPGRGGENFWVPNVLASFYFATRENKWLDFLTPYLKPWMTPALEERGGQVLVRDELVAGWYSGGAEVPWGLWLVPIIAWSSVILAIYFLHGCLGVILRAQWAEREALAFPLLRLPLEMTEDQDEHGGRLGRFFRNPMMWCGFGIAIFIQMLNGLNTYFPDVPKIALDVNTSSLFTEPPWNQMGGISCACGPWCWAFRTCCRRRSRCRCGRSSCSTRCS